MKNLLPLIFSIKQLIIGIQVFIYLLLLTSFGAYSQSIIKGTITAADDQLPLISATVAVKGTTTGVVTDFNGVYTLSLKAGSYTLQVSYVGYETKEEAVTIKDNQITILNVTLGVKSIVGKEVVITMQTKGQMAALNQQIRSSQIVNVVSAERIRELPDENAAQAISRLPGVTLDDSKVVIRGVESKMNKILINGIEMPSTEGNSRSTDLGMVSANMLSGIEVFKTLTPDMDADAVGGVVNMRLREAASGFHSSVTTQGTYNQQEKVGSYKVWGDVSNRFLDNKLGVLLNLNFESYNGGNDWITPRYMEYGSKPIGEGEYMFRDISVYDQTKKTINKGGSIVIDYKLPNGKIVFSGMLSQSANEETTNRNYLDADTRHHQIILDRFKNNRLLLNNSIRLEQQLGIVKLDASVANVSIDWADDFRYSVPAKERNNPFINDPTTLGTISYRLSMQPWEIYNFLDTSQLKTYRVIDAELSPKNYSENQWIVDINMQIPLRISDKININFKLGGKHKSMQRKYNSDVYSYPSDAQVTAAIHSKIEPWLTSIGHQPPLEDNIPFPLFRDNNYIEPEGFLNNNPNYNVQYAINQDIADDFMLNQLNPSFLFTRSDLAEDDYWGGEKLYAGYLMGEINLGKRIVIIPGLRYETVVNDYYALKVETVNKTSWNLLDTLSGTATHANWLPHVHIRIRATDWWDIRFSYNNTLARPDYNHALPNVSYSLMASTGTAGNPKIRPAVSENLDANFSFYSRKMGLLTIGGYMKTINDVFYMQPTVIKNIPDSSILAQFPIESYASLNDNLTEFYTNSPYAAYVKGLEFEWQSNFSWLPAPFNGIVLNANYTCIWSETKYMQHRLLSKKVPGKPFPIQYEADTFYVNRLLNQANDVANASLGYDNKGFSARLSFRFQGNVISRIGSRPEENEYTDNVYAYDFVVKQKIPLKFADFEVFFNAINFTDPPFKRYSIYPNRGKTNTYTRYSGAQFQIGLRLRR
jgi:TonB-dependent receptor